MKNEHIVPTVIMSGTPSERGFVYGAAVKEQIAKNIEFYNRLITLPADKKREHTLRFADITEKFNPSLKEEMDGIARGAEVDPTEIYMINARTELLALSGIVHPECSTFFFPKTKILFENWDWLEDSNGLAVMLSITLPNGSKILTFTEAGMVGKIGISSNGFGVAFNYLFPEPNMGGLPVHILLRTLLEQNSYAEALAMLSKEHVGTSGNIMLASVSGENIDAELTGVKTYIINGDTEKPLAHTNHYMAGAVNDSEKAGPGFVSNSFERIERINELLSSATEQSVQDAKQTLSDRRDGHGMLCRDFLVEDPGDGKTGTVASVVMDLTQQKIEVCLHPQTNFEYQVFTF